MEVHREMGPGFLEAVYAEALAVEFELRGVPFQREAGITVSYKGRPLHVSYRADFVCFDGNVIVETKAIAAMSSTEEAQIINYLKATGIKTGLLLNFGEPSLKYKRFVGTGKPP